MSKRVPSGVRLLLVGTIGLFIAFNLSPVGAASANISHSYYSTGGVDNGSLVSLDPGRSNYVEPADTSNGSQLLGVAVAKNDSLLAVDEAAGKVQVATSGTVNALVSTVGGSINVGDAVGVSPFKGIGMKAVAGSPVIGLAQTGFKSDSKGSISQTVTDKQGHKSKLSIGYVRLSIAITTEGTPDQTNSLQRLAKNLTGHQVSTLRVVLSIAVALIALLILLTLVYASIYGSIISIGRNPLAKYAVLRTLAKVLGMALLTTVMASLIIFLLLR